MENFVLIIKKIKNRCRPIFITQCYIRVNYFFFYINYYLGKKIEVRVYFFIASTNPLIIYAQNKELLRWCQDNFDVNNSEKFIHVCNVALAGSTNKENSVIDFELEELQDYLLE